MARHQCRIELTMFLPTPKSTRARSREKKVGSCATASTPFLSQPCRNGNVSWPENESMCAIGSFLEVSFLHCRRCAPMLIESESQGKKNRDIFNSTDLSTP